MGKIVKEETKNKQKKKMGGKPAQEKKGSGSVVKIVGIVVGVVIVLGMLTMTIISFNNRRKAQDTKPEDFMVNGANPDAKRNGEQGGQNNKDNPAGQKDKPKEKAKLAESNPVDPAKTQQVSGNTKEDTNKKYTTDELANMTKEERAKALKDSVDNRQDTNEKGFLTADEIKNGNVKLPIDPNEIAEKEDYANYTKHATKLADRTFLLWLDCRYQGKKYYMVCEPSLWNELKDVGITPVTVKYFVDSGNRENVLSLSPRTE